MFFVPREKHRIMFLFGSLELFITPMQAGSFDNPPSLTSGSRSLHHMQTEQVGRQLRPSQLLLPALELVTMHIQEMQACSFDKHSPLILELVSIHCQEMQTPAIV